MRSSQVVQRRFARDRLRHFEAAFTTELQLNGIKLCSALSVGRTRRDSLLVQAKIRLREDLKICQVLEFFHFQLFTLTMKERPQTCGIICQNCRHPFIRPGSLNQHLLGSGRGAGCVKKNLPANLDLVLYVQCCSSRVKGSDANRSVA